MNRIFVIALILGLLFTAGCQREVSELEQNAIEAKASARLASARLAASNFELHRTQVLLKGSIEMRIAFGDVNSDSKLDLFIGSAGHEFIASDERPIQLTGEAYRRGMAKRGETEQNQLSIHLNETSDSKSSPLSFGSAKWLSDWKLSEYWLPVG